MADTKNKAQRLAYEFATGIRRGADAKERWCDPEADAELRRLDAENAALLSALEWALDAMAARNPVWTEGERFIAASSLIRSIKDHSNG